jgi:hypothetical protein
MVRPLEAIRQRGGTRIFMATTAILATTPTILSTPPWLATGTITALPGRGAVITRSQLVERSPGRRQARLSERLSASLTDELLREIAELISDDHAAQWAQLRLLAKNRLSAADAQRVQEAFAARLVAIAAFTPKAKEASVLDQWAAEPAGAPQIDESVLPFPESRRIRDRDHIRFIIKHPCLI